MMPSNPHILVAGIGNIFLGDDAFGSEVARRLIARPQPPGVRIVDFGIRGLDLVYALMDGCDTAILIDAVPRPDEPPGTLYLLEPRLDDDDSTPPELETHSMDPVKVLRAALAMGARPCRVLVVGCQPSRLPESNEDEGDDMSMELSPPVAAAIEPAVQMIESLIHDALRNCPEPNATIDPLEVLP